MILEIVRLELAQGGPQSGRAGHHFEATDAAVAKLAEQGFDPRFGARPVRRVIQQEVQDRLADMILAGEVLPEQAVVLDVDEGGFTLGARKAKRQMNS